MYERVVALLVDALYLYCIAGLFFAIAFITTGVKRIDSQAIGSGVGFRVLIFPGAAALWPSWFAGGFLELVSPRQKGIHTDDSASPQNSPSYLFRPCVVTTCSPS